MKKCCREEILNINGIPGIYILKNIQNGKRYIGQSTNLQKKLLKIFTSSERKIKGTALQEDINSMGIESFQFDILKTIDPSCNEIQNQLNNFENEYIQKYNPEYNSVKIISIKQEPEQIPVKLIFVYLINGDKTCKYITSCDLEHLNIILKYKKLPLVENTIDTSDYLFATSQKELQDKIKNLS